MIELEKIVLFFILLFSINNQLVEIDEDVLIYSNNSFSIYEFKAKNGDLFRYLSS